MKAVLAPRRSSLAALSKAYDRAAETWHRGISRIGFIDAYDELVTALPDVPAQPSGQFVLDAGCGTAGLALAFGKRYPDARFHLLDLSERMLELARRNLGKEGLVAGTICCDVNELPDPDQCYDVVVSAHLIEHCKDPRATLTRLWKALRPGGQLIMVVSKPHWCTALLRLRWGHRAFEPSEVESLLRVCGFEGVRIHVFSSGPPSRLSVGYAALKPKKEELK